MNLVDNIKSQLNTMTKSEKTVATHFLKKPSDFAFLTLEKIAETVGLSTTSVLRFCRRLHYAGYKDFQEDVRKGGLFQQPDLPAKYTRISEKTDGNELLRNTIVSGISCVRESFDSFDSAELDRALQLLSGAERIFTLGLKESFAMSHYLYTRLTTVRKNVFLLNPGFETDGILSMTERDAVVVFLFHRYTRATLQMLPLLAARGIRVLLITSPPNDSVKEYATIILNCLTDASGIKNTFAAPLILCDYLCNALAVLNGGKSLDHMKNLEALFKASETVI